MERERTTHRGLYLLVFVILVAHLRHVLAECPDKLVTCFCPGGNYVKMKVSQYKVSGTCQLWHEPDERKFCLTTQVLSQCAEDGNRIKIEGDDKHFRHPRIRRHIQSCSQGINISDSIPEGLPIVKGERHLEDFVDKDFTLKCFVYSRTPANITWIANGRLIKVKLGDSTYKYRIIPISIPSKLCYQELQIKGAEITDSGNYVCVVTNKHGTVNSTSSITVREKHLGKISIAKMRLESENQKAIFGGSVNITCTIHDPSRKDIQGIWFKNGKRAVDDAKRQIWNMARTSASKYEKKMVLILKNVTVEDEGNWTCGVKGGRPITVLKKSFTLITEPCPGGHYCPWRENKKYPCPYGTYTNGSSEGTVLRPTDCLECPGVSQGSQPEGIWQPAASLGGCSTEQSGKISIDKMRLESENQKAILGGSVNITCTIHDPCRTAIQGIWFKNGKRASDDGKRRFWNLDGTSASKYERKMVLILKNVTVEDEGNWTCGVKGEKPLSVQRKTFILTTEPCPGGHYCPWRENKKYTCPYGTYTNGSSDGTVLRPTDCFECPGVPQGTQPEGTWQSAASLGGCPSSGPKLNRSKDRKGAGTSLTVILLASVVGVLFVLLCVILIVLYKHKRRFTFRPYAMERLCSRTSTQTKV